MRRAHPIRAAELQRAPAFLVQRAKRTPTYTGASHATTVTLQLNQGDTFDAGSAPSVSPDGWDALDTLGLVPGGGDNWHKWIRFHTLNERAGGAGDNKGNLAPVPQRANRARKWNIFERLVKTFMPENAGAPATKATFRADVGYPAAQTIYWEETGTNATAKTNSSHYPSTVDATLDVKWTGHFAKPRKYKANMDASDGLICPEDLRVVGNWNAYTDAAHTAAAPAGTKP